MTMSFIQDYENNLQEKAHPQKENLKSTLLHFPKQKDKTDLN